MMNSYFRFIPIFIICAFIVSLTGCGIGVRPRDMPPEEEVYYEESTHEYYYDTPRSGGYRYYDPNYDPWTMGTYYQRYSGHYGSAPSSSGDSGATSSQSANSRPTVKARNSASVQSSKAPTGERASLKRDRSSTRSKTESNSTHSSITRRKVRRESSRSSKKQSSVSQTRVKKRRTTEQSASHRTRSKKTEEEEEEKKSR